MRLADYQQGLSDLLRGDSTTVRDSYLRAVRESESLKIAREIVQWWRGFAVEQICPLTTRLLRQEGAFESLVEAFCTTQSFSAYVEQLGIEFLNFTESSTDPLTASVAGFERALCELRRGPSDPHRILWPRDPVPVLEALLTGEAASTCTDEPHLMVLTANGRGGIDCTVAVIGKPRG